ncbi:MAG: GGDEF domain-containing protein [Gammaproteobacteria bacterium]|nr:MAG: GGDEF domain-containing protein [Gammaproteobacteria bacterium]
MEYSEYQERASEYMRLAIPIMKKYGIAMTPANYAVWYEYVSGSNIALNDAVDLHIEEHGSLSDSQSADLYQRFFEREKDQTALLEMRQDLRRVLEEVLSYVSNGVNSSKQSRENLAQSLEKLHPDMTREQVHEVIEEVLSETRLAMSSGTQLTERLNSALAEMQDLRKDLDDTKREAKTDTLTKLANRKAFDDVITKVTKDADRSGIEVCLIFGDLDLFKDINDKHGHMVGDQVLKVVSSTLKGAVKGRDLVARYGGEEFTIVLLNTSIANAVKLADAIRVEIASKRIQRKDTRESLGAITMSFGVARYVPSEGVESLLQRADRALYMSKRKGRNAVSEAPPPII